MHAFEEKARIGGVDGDARARSSKVWFARIIFTKL